MSLVLPPPISANRYWQHGVAGKPSHVVTFVSKEARVYKNLVRIAAYEQGIRRPMIGRVALEIRVYPHRPLDWEKRARRDPMNWDDTVQCLDLDNALKVLIDALKGIAFKDDTWVRRIVAERMEPDEAGARVVVTIEPIVRQSPQPALELETA